MQLQSLPSLLLTHAALTTAASVLQPRQNTTTASFPCNNSPLLCARSYSNVTYLGAHDSPFTTSTTSSGSFNIAAAANQNFTSTSQLNAGVRLLTAQVHMNNNTWHLCHTSCSILDAGPLSNWLSEIKSWLDNNPHDVVTLLLVNSDNATPSDLHSEFLAANNLTQYAYTPPSTTTSHNVWPTLQEMITANTRLVTFVESLSNTEAGVAPYLLNEYTFIFENNYNNTTPNSFSCDANRPSGLSTSTALESARLPLLNHFLYANAGMGISYPNTNALGTTNAAEGQGSLGQAANTCAGVYGKAPNFLLVDFFDVGDTVGVVNKLNGIEGNVVGQTTPRKGYGDSALSGAGATRKILIREGIWISALGGIGLAMVIWG